MLNRLKALPLTIVLTILIWMYAESHFAATREGVPLRVRITAPSEDLAIKPIDVESVNSAVLISAKLQGPASQVDHISTGAEAGDGSPDTQLANLNYTLSKTETSATDETTVDTVSMLNSIPYFREHGVVVLSANPPRIRIELDRMARLQKTASFRAGIAVNNVKLNPETVTILVPSKKLHALEPDAETKVAVAAIPTKDLSRLPPDTDQQAAVHYEVTGIKDDRIKVLEEGAGTASFHIPAQQPQTQLVPNIDIYPSGPAELLERYRVEIQPAYVNLTVSGSGVPLQTLRERLANAQRPGNGSTDTGIRAYLDLSPSDHPTSTFQRKTLRYVLPEGLTQADGPLEAEYRLTEKNPVARP